MLQSLSWSTMSAVVSATDILPTLYDNDEDLDGTRESHEDVVDDLNYDIYNLVAFNYHPVRIVGDDEEKEEAIMEAATRATQLLVKRLGMLQQISAREQAFDLLVAPFSSSKDVNHFSESIIYHISAANTCRY